MPDYVLDYSASRLTGAQVKAYNGKPEANAKYIGAVRYAGSGGQQDKEATKAELDSYVSNGLGVALVYETTSGWWKGGSNAGVKAAKAIKADAAAWGYWGKIRAYYFTADEDVTPATLPLFKAAIAGAVSVLDYDLVGAYGEADVINAVVGIFCRWGWQTRAWSGGRVSSKAHILQLVGYVYPGGFDADRSLVLKSDWGQYPIENGEDMPLTDSDATVVWSHDLRPGDGSERAFEVLNDARAQGVAARDQAAAAKTAAAAALSLAQSNATAVSGLVTAVSALSTSVASLGGKLDALNAKMDALTVGGSGLTDEALASLRITREDETQ